MQFYKAKNFILDKLKTDLPKFLLYHGIQHTTEVINYAEELAKAENISGDELTILSTAALLHDTGFLEAYIGHEEVSCSFAQTYLHQFDYNDEQIRKVCDLIMATKIPQDPKDKLAEILCDADLYYLGTDNYTARAENLYLEMYEAGTIKSREEWIHQQIKFLHSHQYFTETAKAKLSEKQHQNLLALEQDESSHKSVTGHKDFYVSDIILIILGVITAGFALKGFLVPNDFFDGGVTGISLLIHEILMHTEYKINLAYIILIANLPFIIMGIYSINKRFAAKTLFCIIMLGLCLLYIPYPLITSDKLLVSIFGGFFLGVGIGLTMRAGCAVDGIEVLALYTWRKTSFTISEIIMALNIVIFSIAAFHFGLPTALYSMLTYFTASKTVDYVVEGIEAYTGVTIISGKSEIIKDRLVNELRRGITVYKGERGYLPGKFEVHSDVDIIFTIITRLEMRKLKNLVNDIDPNAFVFASTIKEASGGIIKRRHIH
ncbi:MAG TPA: YitT family protein [Puia sp.]|nr:YitT family protein [Puia sp.]